MENTSELRNIKSKKLYLRVYDEIREYILQNKLQPGDKLPTEMEMCHQLGVSRNVLREAIKSLEITGIVTSKPGVGIIIRECNMDYIMSSFTSNLSVNNDSHMEEYVEELRRILEIGFMDAAFDSITDEDLDILAEQVGIMQKEYAAQSKVKVGPSIGAAFARADAAFHHTIFSHIENRLMVSIIDFFWAYDKYYKVKTTHEYLRVTVDKHVHIYEALRARDRDAFHDAMQYHFNCEYYKK